jgi:hypothetical protein
VAGNPASIALCVQELEKAQFTVSADVVLTLSDCTQRFRSQSYDVVIAEYFEREHIAQLPMAIRRVLNEKNFVSSSRKLPGPYSIRGRSITLS